VLADIIAKLESGDKVDNNSLFRGTLYCCSNKRRSRKMMFPATAIRMVFAYIHDSPLGGHLGIFKTINKIRSHFFWKRMGKDIRSRGRACHSCALSKPAQSSRLGFLASEVAQRPKQNFFVDYVGKLTLSKVGNTAFVICVDAFSKFVWMIPVHQATTRTTIKHLKERIFSSFFVPERFWYRIILCVLHLGNFGNFALNWAQSMSPLLLNNRSPHMLNDLTGTCEPP
jgi:hypothetical protein